MSDGRKQPGNTRKSRKRVRSAIVLLTVIAACLVTVLTILPSREEGGGPGPVRFGESGPAQFSQPERVEQDAPQRPAPGVDPAAVVGSGRQERPSPRVRVAVVIDDVGYSLEELQVFLDFPAPVSLSVLPNLPYSREAARRIVEAGKELLLHLPMEAVNGNDPGPGVIRTTHSEEEIRSLLDSNFSQVPRAVGMNNHMGSRATADERVMNVVMEYLQLKRHVFLDSRTTTETLGAATARTYAVPYLERDIFLDNEPQIEEIEKALASGIEVARKKGYAILIGHVRNPQIVDVLGRSLSELKRSGVELVSLSALLKEMGEDS
ncbi:MAG: divergent polysaccharide deacetylase family protein [Spirochaetaceae bacterium]|nr:MAG: divergent polysaccharide deacetylase family protein [Spirochaetaceae bacterium]